MREIEEQGGTKPAKRKQKKEEVPEMTPFFYEDSDDETNTNMQPE